MITGAWCAESSRSSVGALVPMLENIRRRLFQSKSRKRRGFSFELNGHVFSEPSLLQRKTGKVLSKIGRVSWSAIMDGNPVKIYECCDEAQALFIESVSNHSSLRSYFPKCLMRIEKYLVAEWVQGEQVTWRRIGQAPELLAQIAKMQALMHMTVLEGNDNNGFNYVAFLKNRLERYAGIVPLSRTVERIYDLVDGSGPPEIKRVSHPDVTANNLIIEESTGILYLVDNESMTQNKYYLIDLFNTYFSMGSSDMRSELLEQYLTVYAQHGGDLSYLVLHQDFFHALWYLRLIGSLLQSGRIEAALKLAQQYSDGPLVTHPLVNLVKERFI